MSARARTFAAAAEPAGLGASADSDGGVLQWQSHGASGAALPLHARPFEDSEENRAPTQSSQAPLRAATARGLMLRSFKFNTIVASKLSSKLKQALRDGTNNVPPIKIRFTHKVEDLPKGFDPRTPEGIDPQYRKFWFFEASGELHSVLTIPLDQAGCGSCWAFSSSSMFTDRARIALLKRYGKAVCGVSPLFKVAPECTGETNAEKAGGGVVNEAKTDTYAIRVRNRISPYFVAAFAPKLDVDSCSASASLDDCVDTDCASALKIWKQTVAKGGGLVDVQKVLGKKYSNCMGCEGNHIAMPLMMFAGDGAALISEFPLQDWACLFGSKQLRDLYCEKKGSLSAEHVKYPVRFRADSYTYATGDDLRSGNHPPGVRSMEDWYMLTIVDFGPVTIGYNVFRSFLDYFVEEPTGIWTVDRFLADIRAGAALKESDPVSNKAPVGGHAVVVVGWGQEMFKGKLVKFWHVRNSWGVGWGDRGFFRIERNMDARLPKKNAVGFEDEFGTVYFAPDPNPALYDPKHRANGMGEYMGGHAGGAPAAAPPDARCYPEDISDDYKNKHQKDCNCPHGQVVGLNGKCIVDKRHHLSRALAGHATGAGDEPADGATISSFFARHKRAIALFAVAAVAAAAFANRKKIAAKLRISK